ncbi:MAG: hypothetical protein WCO07_01335 [bacterium]
MEEIKQQLKDNFAEHKTLMEKIDNLKESVEEIKITLAGLPDKIFDRADRRYAYKTTERAMYALIGAICLAFIYALVALVIK